MSPKRTVEIIPVSEPEHRDGVVGSDAESKAGSGPELGRDRRIVNSAWLVPMRRSRLTARYFAKNRRSANEERSLAERIKAGDSEAAQRLVTATLGLALRSVIHRFLEHFG
jgi:hypothetical protein